MGQSGFTPELALRKMNVNIFVFTSKECIQSQHHGLLFCSLESPGFSSLRVQELPRIVPMPVITISH